MPGTKRTAHRRRGDLYGNVYEDLKAAFQPKSESSVELFMKRISNLFVPLLLAGHFVLLSGSVSATECVGFVPSKPVRHVAGIVINPIGERVQGAEVSVLKEGKLIAALKTDPNGKFSFGRLEAGTYQMEAHSDGYLDAEFPIVIAEPSLKDRRAVQIGLAVGGGCSGAVLIKPSKIK